MLKKTKAGNFLFRRWPLPLLFLLVLLFLMPLLTGWGKFFYDDIAFIFYPQQVFLARCLGEGVIPWWNPHLCAGATPFYSHIFQSSLSPANWPFLWMGLLDSSGSYFWLIRLPLAFSYLLSVVFAYLFSRLGLELDRPGSVMFSVAYTFSPFMIYFSTCPPEVYAQAWLPLLCLCVIRFARGGGWRWLVLGALAWGLASPAGDVPVVFQVILLTALFGAGLFVVMLLERNRRGALRVVMGGGAVFLIGFFLSGVYWLNMIVGLQMLGAEAEGVVESLSGPSQSLHPLYLITLAVPDYFGGVTSHHTWGAAFLMKVTLSDVNLLGGMVAGFLVFLAFDIVPATEREGVVYRAWRRWWWLFGFLFIFGIFVVLSAYTPVHGIARRIIPILRMPYPVRFRSIECFALAGLLGVSTSLLLRFPVKNKLRKLLIYAGIVIILAGLVLIYPYRVPGSPVQSGWRHLADLNNWSWFLAGPVLYLALAVSALTFVVVFRRGRYLRLLLVIFTVIEIFYFAYQAFYINKILNFRYWDFYARRYHGPLDQPEYQKILSWRPETEGTQDLFRRLYFRSYFDNLAWLDGSSSMLGFDIKPIDTRFQGIVEELADGFPYEIKIKRWASRFWPNMSARHILAERPLHLSRLEFRDRVGEWYSYEDPSALPRVFVLDRVVGCSEAEARNELLEGNLKRGVFVEENVQLSVISNQKANGRLLIADYRSFEPGDEDEYLSHFDRLQAKDPIISCNFSNPNRVEIEVEMSEPAMLILTDVWHPDWEASLDEKPIPLHRVNYLQRGIWCPRGRHRVIMDFRPETLSLGLGLTGFGFVSMCGLIMLTFRSSRKEKFRGGNS